MKLFKILWPLILLVSLTLLLGNSIGTVPPLGKLFSPFTGFWQNIEDESHISENLDFKGLKEEVIIKFDDNRVPHIFAKNDHDLYFAQGYTVASDRLWQMEFYTKVAAGRLTEIVGKQALAYDQYNRRIGMAQAAENIIRRSDESPESKKSLEAFAEGVNAYISNLAEKDFPIEYKILNYQPENWSPLKTALMLMMMRNDLNGKSSDFKMTQVAQKYGMDIVNDLFPNYPAKESPIIPVGTPLDFIPLTIPDVPEKIMAFTSDPLLAENFERENPNIGSNNWAIAGSKSATGLPILANDPHLGLSFPSIWYQVQLHAPNVNVYGTCLPGMPGVTIGFNKNIAWGVTNVGPDIMDFYKIKFKDESHNEYWHDDQWKKTSKRVETYLLKGGEIVADTVISTHHGPIVYLEDNASNFKKDVPAGYAMKWITHDSAPTDLDCFYELNRANNYADYRKALSHYVAPAQNFVFASNENDIAITPNGKLPLKWAGQGKFLLDGTLKSHDWQGYLPAAHNPHVKNPERGFVSSANQSSTDPTYPYYLDWSAAPSYRGTQINNRLAKMENATADSLRSMQNDNYNLAAEWFLPHLLPILKNSTEVDQEKLAILLKWNKYNDPDEIGATIYETYHSNLMEAIWSDDFPQEKNMMPPSGDRTLVMLSEEKEAKWFDDKNTPDVKETMDNIVVSSFNKSIDDLSNKYGPLSENWNWTKVKATRIAHLIPAFDAFSEFNVSNGGGSKIVNATSEKWGPSWRMIVELDKKWPTAYGIYPGGQSGNPGSKYYKNMLADWTAGELQPLLYLKNELEESSQIKSEQTLNAKQ